MKATEGNGRMQTSSNKTTTNRLPSSSENILDRVPPHDLHSEIALLGSLLFDPQMIDEVSLQITSDDFYDDANAKLFDCLLKMNDAGKKIDPVLLRDRLKSDDQWEVIGGGAYLSRVLQSVPNASHAIYYAGIVKRHATVRHLIDVACETLNDAYSETLDADSLLEQTERKFFAISERTVKSEPIDARRLLLNTLNEMDARISGQKTTGVATGFSDLDALIGGMRGGQLLVVAGRPGQGKTALGLGISANAALKDHTVLFVSLEMTALELGDRLLSMHSEIPLHRLRQGTISQDDRHKLVEVSAELSASKLHVIDSSIQSVRTIGANARRLKRKSGLALIVVDYLQLVEPMDRKVPREQQVAQMTRQLKALSKDCEVPVLVMAQLNRQTEEAKDHRPRLSHLRESGSIEQDADVVIFVHREEYYLSPGERRDEVKGKAEIMVAKQRNGPIGDVEMVWIANIAKFVDKAPERIGTFDKWNAGDDLDSF